MDIYTVSVVSLHEPSPPVPLAPEVPTATGCGPSWPTAGAGTGRGETERAANSLAGRLGLSEAAIRRDLERGDDSGFEKTALHDRVFAYAEQLDKRKQPRAVVPRIDLQSPKFTRKLTTEWFAKRVDERHRHCLARIVTPADD